MTNANRSRLSGVRKRVLLGLLLALAVGLVAFPAGVWAADAFTDVPEGNVHHDSVDAIVDAGVTKGCAEGAYCPADAVRRDQMASFMDRLGALSEGQEPVVNAATAQQAENAEQAANSSGVGGVDAQELLDRIEELEDQTAAAESPDGEADSDLAARVDALESDLAAATDRIDTIESELSTANSRIDTLEGDLSTANSRIDSLEATVANQAESITALDGRVSDLEDDSGGGELESRVESLETTFSGVTREQRPVNPEDEAEGTRSTLVFEGMNVQLLNGHEDEEGETDTASANGLGNLIMGYNEHPVVDSPASRTGSHNLVVGDRHEWTTSGGVVAGIDNTISGDWATVTGGRGNVASGLVASVSGGNSNTASGTTASVSGGRGSTASGEYSSVSGGGGHEASGVFASVSGGGSNIASGRLASVSAGQNNTASGQLGSVSGGYNNTTDGYATSVAGGFENSVISGGFFGTVSGGTSNTVSGENASVSGGEQNTASGNYSSILGGESQSVDTEHGMYPAP